MTGRAVLFHTGWATHWGSDRYGDPDHPHLTEATAKLLVDQEVHLVGIDSVNIDDTRSGSRPAHTLLLSAGIPIVEHLTGLEALPETGFRFFATPTSTAGHGDLPGPGLRSGRLSRSGSMPGKGRQPVCQNRFIYSL